MSAPTTSRCSQEKKRNYFRKHRLMLKLVGVSLGGDESTAYKVYSFLFLFFFNFLYAFLDVLEMFKLDIDTVANTILYPLTALLAFGKTVVFVRNRIKIGKLLDQLEQEPFLPNRNRGGEEEETLMSKFLWLLNVQTVLYWVYPLLFVTVLLLQGIIKRITTNDYREWVFSFGPFSPFNVTYSPNYEIAWMYQTFSVLDIIIHFVTVDLIIFGVYGFISFQFKMLQNFIRQIVEISYFEMLKETAPGNLSETVNSNTISDIDGSVVPWKYLKDSVAQVVNYHLSIIDIAGEAEELFNGLVLYMFLNTMGLTCLLIIQATRTDDYQWFLTAAGFMVCGQLLVNCFWVEQVMSESQEVGRAAYESNFVGADLRFQKALCLIIRRSQKPCVLTAGKFTVVCIATFTWIIKTSYSASTVLRQVNQ